MCASIWLQWNRLTDAQAVNDHSSAPAEESPSHQESKVSASGANPESLSHLRRRHRGSGLFDGSVHALGIRHNPRLADLDYEHRGLWSGALFWQTEILHSSASGLPAAALGRS